MFSRFFYPFSPTFPWLQLKLTRKPVKSAS
jgi:hypothetical protein